MSVKRSSAKIDATESIALTFEHKGYKVERNTKIGPGIYGYDIYADLLVLGLKEFPLGLIIETKYQDKSGSTDEKLPYMVMNIKQFYFAPTIILMDGDGFRKGAVDWVRSQVGGKLVDLFVGFDSIMNWISILPDRF